MEVNIEWVREDRRYFMAEVAKLGRWKVGEFYFDSSRPRGQEEAYKVVMHLPGLKSEAGHFKTEEEAKAKVEHSVGFWIKDAGLAVNS